MSSRHCRALTLSILGMQSRCPSTSYLAASVEYLVNIPGYLATRVQYFGNTPGYLAASVEYFQNTPRYLAVSVQYFKKSQKSKSLPGRKYELSLALRLHRWSSGCSHTGAYLEKNVFYST